jgi:hypothetical protein
MRGSSPVYKTNVLLGLFHKQIQLFFCKIFQFRVIFGS